MTQEAVSHVVQVWVCPTCGNYYGASSAGDLSKQMAEKKHGPSHTRDTCPDCGDKRVLCVFAVELVPQEVVDGTLAELPEA